MSQDDYYRKQAEDAQKHADETTNDADRSSWRRLAKSWFGLIRLPSTKEKEKARGKDTEQKDVSRKGGLVIDFNSPPNEPRPKKEQN